MDQLPLHNALVHLPLGLSIGGAALALALLAGVLRKWFDPRALALLALIEALVLAGGALAFRSGEQAAERKEDDARVEQHEERAEAFLWISGVSLLVTGAAYAARHRRWSRWALVAAAGGAIATAAAGVWVGKAGGAIAHGDVATRTLRAVEDDDD
jgi:hypothetical protein